MSGKREHSDAECLLSGKLSLSRVRSGGEYGEVPPTRPTPDHVGVLTNDTRESEALTYAFQLNSVTEGGLNGLRDHEDQLPICVEVHLVPPVYTHQMSYRVHL
jgi:hypothetical protein